MCSYNNILTKRKHQFHARSQKSGSKLLAPTVPKSQLNRKTLLVIRSGNREITIIRERNERIIIDR